MWRDVPRSLKLGKPPDKSLRFAGGYYYELSLVDKDYSSSSTYSSSPSSSYSSSSSISAASSCAA